MHVRRTVYNVALSLLTMGSLSISRLLCYFNMSLFVALFPTNYYCFFFKIMTTICCSSPQTYAQSSSVPHERFDSHSTKSGIPVNIYYGCCSISWLRPERRTGEFSSLRRPGISPPSITCIHFAFIHILTPLHIHSLSQLLTYSDVGIS